MKKFLGILVLLAIILWSMGQSDWHINRNENNDLPKGNLTKISKVNYRDDAGRIWELLPQSKNIFHQPDKEINNVLNPYQRVSPAIKLDTKNPNLKFLSKDDKGGSYEAILQPTGGYLVNGTKRGTYNYGHPSGLSGTIKHAILDVLPHFVNTNYKIIERPAN